MRNINSFLIFISLLAIFVMVGCENGDPDTCNCTCGQTEETVEVTEDVGEGIVETEAVETEEAEEAVGTEETEEAEEAVETEETEEATETEETEEATETGKTTKTSEEFEVFEVFEEFEIFDTEEETYIGY